MTIMNAITEIFEIVVPVFFVLLIGYISERAKKLTVIRYKEYTSLFSILPSMLPCLLERFYKPLLAPTTCPFFLALVGSMGGIYIVAILLERVIFHLNFGSHTLLGSVASFPSASFYGTAILSSLYG
jgi:predicted permease